MVTQIYQVLPFGRRGPGCSGYKDADLPGPAIWQKGPWLPWLQRHTLNRSGDLAEGALFALVTKTDLPDPAIWQKWPWLPWLQRHRRTRPCDLAEEVLVALVTETQTYQVLRSGRRGHGCPGCRSRLCPQCTSAGRRPPVVHRRWRQSCTCC